LDRVIVENATIGKYDFYKLHVVDSVDHTAYATIDIGEPDFSS